MKRKLSSCATTAAGGDCSVEPRDKHGDSSNQISSTEQQRMSQSQRDEDRDGNSSSSSRSRKTLDQPPLEGDAGCGVGFSSNSILVRQNACIDSSANPSKEIPPPSSSSPLLSITSSSSDLPLISSEKDNLARTVGRPKGHSFNSSIPGDLLHSQWARFFFTSPGNENCLAISDCVSCYNKKK